MPDFTDSKQTVWEIAVNGATIKRALAELGVDLGKPLEGDPPLLTRFDTDLAFKVDLLFVVCLPQARAREISDEQFAERLEGEALYRASTAFFDAWQAFFLSLRRKDLAAAIAKERRAVEALCEMAGQKLQRLDGLIDREAEKLGREIDAEIDEMMRDEDGETGPTKTPGGSSAS